MLIYIILGVIVIVVLAAIAIYNKLVRLRNTVKTSWSDIDVQCKKRYDLVPNLVETVKGYASHERTVFEKVTQARSMAMQATTPAEMAKAENMIRETLKSLFAVAEAYPELKATPISSSPVPIAGDGEQHRICEKVLQFSSGDFNIMIESFPSNITASQFKFKQAELFQLEAPGSGEKTG
jgi:LemA protein